MRKHSLFFKSLALLTIVLPLCLAANGKRVDQETREKTIPIVDDFDAEEASECPNAHRSGFFFSNYPPVYYPASSHWITSMSVLGDSLDIEDGSSWELDPWESSKAVYWKLKTPITITQNTAWFSKYYYRLVDQTTGQSIPANLKLAPFEDSEHANFISFLDRRQGGVALTNGLNFMVCPKDERVFSVWQEGQAIIIGTNAGWQNETYNLILINVYKNTFVRAKQI